MFSCLRHRGFIFSKGKGTLYLTSINGINGKRRSMESMETWVPPLITSLGQCSLLWVFQAKAAQIGGTSKRWSHRE